MIISICNHFNFDPMLNILNVYIYSVYHVLHVFWNLYMTLGHPYMFGPMPHP